MSILKLLLESIEIPCDGTVKRVSEIDLFIREATFFVKNNSGTIKLGIGSDESIWSKSWEVIGSDTKQVIPPKGHYNLKDFYFKGDAGVSLVCFYGVDHV